MIKQKRKLTTGCLYLDENKVGASDIGIRHTTYLEGDNIEVTDQETIDYCTENCPYDHCLLEDMKRGKNREQRERRN